MYEYKSNINSILIIYIVLTIIATFKPVENDQICIENLLLLLLHLHFKRTEIP